MDSIGRNACRERLAGLRRIHQQHDAVGHEAREYSARTSALVSAAPRSPTRMIWRGSLRQELAGGQHLGQRHGGGGEARGEGGQRALRGFAEIGARR